MQELVKWFKLRLHAGPAMERAAARRVAAGNGTPAQRGRGGEYAQAAELYLNPSAAAEGPHLLPFLPFVCFP